jgi:hypothetical protein
VIATSGRQRDIDVAIDAMNRENMG